MDTTLNSETFCTNDSIAVEFPGDFAVLMALYTRDDPSLFEMAVSSVFSNTLMPTHCLIVIDGPLNEALECSLQTLQNRYGKRIELLRLPTNVGLAGALNEGLAHLKCTWIVRADSDDFNLSNRFLMLARLLQSQPQLELMGSAILEVDKLGKPISVRQVPESETEIRQFVKTRNPFNHMAVAYRRETVLACGGYPNVYLKEDYALWCHMLSRQVRVANTNEVLVHATAGYDMYSRRGGWKYARAEWYMQRVLVACGLKQRWKAYIDGLLRAAVFLAPVFVRAKVYQIFLRKRY
jgi:cellulose synthase/poly-beta-1,6-N-acetylglucosamine synthase-like glycosyltransferase